MSRRLALLAAVPLATLAAAAPAAGAPASSPPPTAQQIFLDYGDLESHPSTSVVVLIGANNYGLVARPG